MCFNKSHLGSEIHIPSTGSSSGKGVRISVVKRMSVERAMLESDYQDSHGDLVFDGSSQLFYSTNKRAGAMELIHTLSTDVWDNIKKNSKKNEPTLM